MAKVSKSKGKRKNKKLDKKSIVYIVMAVFVLSIAVGCYIVRHRDDDTNKAANSDVTDASDSNYKLPTAEEKAKSIKANPEACIGNEADTCVLSPSVDFWPSPGEGATNPELNPPASSIVKCIGGIMISHSGKNIILKTTSGRTFTIEFPLNAISWWNQARASNYGNYQMSDGDTFNVYYYEEARQNATTVKPHQILSSSMTIDPSTALSSNIKRYVAE